MNAQKKLTDEEENVLSSRGAEEEHHSLQGHHSYGVVQDLTPGGVTPKDLYQHGLGRNHRHATQHQKQAEPHRLGGSHQKCGSVSGAQTSHTSLVKSGQRAAQFGFATAAQQHRSGAPLKSSATASSLVHSRSTAKHGNSTSKKSAHHGANASATAGPRQGMQKVGSGGAAVSYEPVLRNIQSRESQNKKHSSVSLAAPANAHKQQTHSGQGKQKYLSPTVRPLAPHKGYAKS